jgi:hypothetical protein
LRSIVDNPPWTKKNVAMRRVLWWSIGIVLGLGALFYALQDPEYFLHTVREPFRMVWASHQELQARIIDASEGEGSPVQTAGRRLLLKPFGHLQLMRILPVPSADSSSDSKKRAPHS